MHSLIITEAEFNSHVHGQPIKIEALILKDIFSWHIRVLEPVSKEIYGFHLWKMCSEQKFITGWYFCVMTVILLTNSLKVSTLDSNSW